MPPIPDYTLPEEYKNRVMHTVPGACCEGILAEQGHQPQKSPS
jgi:hypothetical protein